MLAPLEQQPAGVLQDRLLALGLELTSLAGADLVDGFAELLHDMEVIQNTNSLRSSVRDNGQVGLSHVGANHVQACRAVWAEPVEEVLERLLLAVFANPQQAAAAGIELVHERQVLVPLCQSISSTPSTRMSLRHTCSRPHRTAMAD